jgi:hypothetical protein
MRIYISVYFLKKSQPKIENIAMKKWRVTVHARGQKNDDGARDHQQPHFAHTNSNEQTIMNKMNNTTSLVPHPESPLMNLTLTMRTKTTSGLPEKRGA